VCSHSIEDEIANRECDTDGHYNIAASLIFNPVNPVIVSVRRSGKIATWCRRRETRETIGFTFFLRLFVLFPLGIDSLLAEVYPLAPKALTRASNTPRVRIAMMGKRLFLVMAAGTLLFLQFTSCVSATTPDQQTMQCCRSMPCTPANRSYNCCKTMISTHAPNMLRSARVTLDTPRVTVADSLPAPDMNRPTGALRPRFEAPQHSPPELYTLHASLLI